MVSGIENVYTQHKSLLHTVLKELLQGKLKEGAYPTLAGTPPGQQASRGVGDCVTADSSRDALWIQLEA